MLAAFKPQRCLTGFCRLSNESLIYHSVKYNVSVIYDFVAKLSLKLNDNNVEQAFHIDFTSSITISNDDYSARRPFAEPHLRLAGINHNPTYEINNQSA